MTRITINNETAAAIDRAANFIGAAREGLRGLNMTEGDALAGLFAVLGHEEAAERILKSVWHYEDEDCRDPEPWVIHWLKGDKRFATEGEANSDELRRSHFVDFEPRLDWEDA